VIETKSRSREGRFQSRILETVILGTSPRGTLRVRAALLTQEGVALLLKLMCKAPGIYRACTSTSPTL